MVVAFGGMAIAFLGMGLVYWWFFRSFRELVGHVSGLCGQVSALGDLIIENRGGENEEEKKALQEMTRFSSGVSSLMSYEAGRGARA